MNNFSFLHCFRNTQINKFTQSNVSLFFLSGRFLIINFGTDLGLFDQSSDKKYLLRSKDPNLFEVFRRLCNGISYNELLEIIPSDIKDKENFIIELWQRSIII